MAKTLLNAVNDVLKRVNIIKGESGILTSLADSPRQTYIDVAVMIVNETVDDLYSVTNTGRQGEVDETSITLTSDREYDLPADLVELRFPLHDETNGLYIYEYPGGWERMRAQDSNPNNQTGTPSYAAINELTNKLRLDRAPSGDNIGRIYKMLYDKDTALVNAADLFPFVDAVYRALIPAFVQRWKAEQQNSFSQELYDKAMGTAQRLLSRTQRKDMYMTRHGGKAVTDPMEY